MKDKKKKKKKKKESKEEILWEMEFTFSVRLTTSFLKVKKIVKIHNLRYVTLSHNLSIYRSHSVPIYLSIYLIRFIIYQSLWLPLSLSLSLTFSLFVSFSLPLCFFLSLSRYIYIYIYIYLYIYIYIYNNVVPLARIYIYLIVYLSSGKLKWIIQPPVYVSCISKTKYRLRRFLGNSWNAPRNNKLL